MDFEALLEYLDIESGEEFEYHGNFGDLVECDDNIDGDVLYSLLKEVDMEIFAELVDGYFEDIMEHTPEDEMELYNLFEIIKKNFIGLSKAVKGEDEHALLMLSDELEKFHNWFSMENNSICDKVGGKMDEMVCVRDALVEYRLKKLDGIEVNTDFTKALEYPLDEYIMIYGDGVDEE